MTGSRRLMSIEGVAAVEEFGGQEEEHEDDNEEEEEGDAAGVEGEGWSDRRERSTMPNSSAA